jgi:hypothetical protein
MTPIVFIWQLPSLNPARSYADQAPEHNRSSAHQSVRQRGYSKSTLLLIAEQLGSPTSLRPHSQTSAALPRSARTNSKPQRQLQQPQNPKTLSSFVNSTPSSLSIPTPIEPAPLIVFYLFNLSNPQTTQRLDAPLNTAPDPSIQKFYESL